MAPPSALTVCIPSYNRPGAAAKTVLSLLDQAPPEVRIVVQDNCSATEYGPFFAGDRRLRKALESGQLVIKRWIANVGMSANFLRAFESAESEWVWLLSDDDRVRPTAVRDVLNVLHHEPAEIGFVKFRSGLADERVVLDSLERFIDYNDRSPQAFNGFIFISNGLYRLSAFRPLVEVGYRYCHTYVPHFMMISQYMAGGNLCALHSREVVDYVVPELGYSYSMVAGLGVGAPKHMLLKTSAEHYRRFSRIFFPHNDFKVLIDLHYQCKKAATPYVCRQLARNYLAYVGVARGIGARAMLRAMYLMLYAPRFFESAIGFAATLNGTVRKHVDEMHGRYGI